MAVLSTHVTSQATACNGQSANAVVIVAEKHGAFIMNLSSRCRSRRVRDAEISGKIFSPQM